MTELNAKKTATILFAAGPRTVHRRRPVRPKIISNLLTMLLVYLIIVIFTGWRSMITVMVAAAGTPDTGQLISVEEYSHRRSKSYSAQIKYISPDGLDTEARTWLSKTAAMNYANQLAAVDNRPIVVQIYRWPFFPSQVALINDESYRDNALALFLMFLSITVAAVLGYESYQFYVVDPRQKRLMTSGQAVEAELMLKSLSRFYARWTWNGNTYKRRIRRTSFLHARKLDKKHYVLIDIDKPGDFMVFGSGEYRLQSQSAST
jgi:hypothetical protein